MMIHLTRLFAVALIAVPLVSPRNAAAESWQVDGVHSGVYFRIGHLDTSYVMGRFNAFTGSFNTGENPSFRFAVETASVDTANDRRDNHLRSPDFFNATEFPQITFTSTSVRQTDAGYELTGDLSLHGETRQVTVNLNKVGESSSERFGKRIGFECEFTVKRSDYGMTNMLNVVGDEVTLMVNIEATAAE